MRDVEDARDMEDERDAEDERDVKGVCHKYDEGLSEFLENGFVRSSSCLLRHLRNRPDISFKIFRPGTRSGSITGPRKHSSHDIFGDNYVYYYDTERKEKFVDFLVSKFYEKNQHPDMRMRTVFTKILHTNGLHWKGCKCSIERRERQRTEYI